MAHSRHPCRSTSRGRSPQPIAEVLSELISRRGYGRVQASNQLHHAWCQAVGKSLAQFSRPGKLRGNTLEVVVADSTLVQEFTFQKIQLLEALNGQLEHHDIRELRFRVGAIDSP